MKIWTSIYIVHICKPDIPWPLYAVLQILSRCKMDSYQTMTIIERSKVTCKPNIYVITLSLQVDVFECI